MPIAILVRSAELLHIYVLFLQYRFKGPGSNPAHVSDIVSVASHYETYTLSTPRRNFALQP